MNRTNADEIILVRVRPVHLRPNLTNTQWAKIRALADATIVG
jgi:hypothetical protein